MTLADRRPLTNAYEPPLPAVRRRSICGAGLGFGPQSSQTGSQSALRRKRISTAYRDDSLTELAQLPIAVDADTDTYAWTTTLRLAQRFGLTIYDATYLELAQRRSLPLATLDVPLRVAAGALGLSLLGTTG